MYGFVGHGRRSCLLACGLFILSVCLCLLGGCADKDGSGKRRGFFERRENTTQSPQKKNANRLEHLPRLDELAQGDDPKQSPLADSGVVAAASLTRIWLPADQTINNIWREVSTVSLSDVELLAWHRNQLRAALVSKEKFNQLLKQMPAHFGLQQQVMTLSGDLIPLDPANSRAAHRPVSLEIQGQSKVYSGGRMQLLISATSQSVMGDKASEKTVLKLTILPHMFVPKVTLLPRDHMQAALDGQIFSELMLRVLMSSDQVLLIAADVPLPVFDDTRPASEPTTGQTPSPSDDASPLTRQPVENGESSQGDGQGEADKTSVNQPLTLPPMSTAPEVKPVPFGLGQAVLTGRQRRRDLFQLWILEVSPIKVSKPLPDASDKQEIMK